MAYDDEYENDDEQESQGSRQLDPNIRRQLREAEKMRKEYAELQLRLAEREKQDLFAEAGLPRDDSTKYFRKGYDGELTVEAVQAEARKVGLLKAPSTAVEDESNADLLAAQRRVAGASIGSSGDVSDPAKEFLTAIDGAKTEAEAMAIVRGELGARVGVYSQRG